MSQKYCLWFLSGLLCLGSSASFAQSSLGINALQSAGAHRQDVGKRLTFVCPASDGNVTNIDGTDIYTDTSPICPAAIHAGVLEAGQAGVVSIVMGSGAESFTGSTRNGVTTRSYGRWDYSYTFARDSEPGSVTWRTAWNWVPLEFTDPVAVVCPPEGRTDGALWGTDVYTRESTICVAAVHAGVISAQLGGVVAVKRAPAPPEFPGTDRNGVTSKRWGKMPDAFTVTAVTAMIAGSRASSGFAPVASNPSLRTFAPEVSNSAESGVVATSVETGQRMVTADGAALLSTATVAPATGTTQSSGNIVTSGEPSALQAPTQNAIAREGREAFAAPPTNVRVEAQNPGLQKLTWSDPGAGQFRVLRRGSSAGTWTSLADPVTGTEYLDKAIVAPDTVYRVEAVYPQGVAAGAEVVHANPLAPEFPPQFMSWQDPTEKVNLRWMSVPKVRAYRLFGPGLPNGGARVDMSPYNTDNGGYPVNYGVHGVPAGTHTFSITSEYGDAGYAVDGMPTTTVTTVYMKGRYRVTVTGFHSNQATNDDPIQHRDGKGDEVFIAVFTGSDIGSTIDRKIVRSRVYGDVNQFPDRIQAGSSSPFGGIGPGNSVPATVGVPVVPMSATADRLPLLVWEGELTNGDRGLAIVPTIWEWDGDGKNYQQWSGWLMGTRYDWRDVMLDRIRPNQSITMYGIGPKLGQDMFGIRMDDSFGKDLPIGYRNIGMITLAADGADRPAYSSTAFMMSRGQIERSLGTSAVVVLPINLRTTGGVGGDYDLYLQVERLPRLP